MFPLVLCSLTVVITLIASGAAKAKDPASTAVAIVNLKIDRWVPMKAASRWVPWAELALGAWIMFASGPAALVGGVAALVLFIFYWAVIARAVFTGNTASCNCFGAHSTAPVSIFTLGRNTALLAAAAGTLIAAASGQSTIGLLLSLDSTDWLWLLAAALPAVALWCVYRAELVPSIAASTPQQATPPAADSSDEPADDDYIRLPIPFGSLFSLEADTVLSLRELAQRQARVLLWVSPTCYPCREVLDRVEQWQKKLPMLKINPVISAREHHKQLGLSPNIEVLIDEDFASEPVFGRGTPLAVALGTDGLVAGGPAVGSDLVIQFMDQLMEEFEVA